MCSLLFRTNAWGGEERETGERALPRALRLLPGSLHIYVYSRDAWGPPPGPPRSAVPELLLILETPAQSRQPWGPSVASASHPPVRTPPGRVGGVYTCPSPVDSHLLGRGGCGFRTTYPNSSVWRNFGQSQRRPATALCGRRRRARRGRCEKAPRTGRLRPQTLVSPSPGGWTPKAKVSEEGPLPAPQTAAFLSRLHTAQEKGLWCPFLSWSPPPRPDRLPKAPPPDASPWRPG